MCSFFCLSLSLRSSLFSSMAFDFSNSLLDFHFCNRFDDGINKFKTDWSGSRSEANKKTDWKKLTKQVLCRTGRAYIHFSSNLTLCEPTHNTSCHALTLCTMCSWMVFFFSLVADASLMLANYHVSHYKCEQIVLLFFILVSKWPKMKKKKTLKPSEKGSGRNKAAAATASIASIRNKIRFGSIGHVMRNEKRRSRRRKKNCTRTFTILNVTGVHYAPCTDSHNQITNHFPKRWSLVDLLVNKNGQKISGIEHSTYMQVYSS